MNLVCGKLQHISRVRRRFALGDEELFVSFFGLSFPPGNLLLAPSALTIPLPERNVSLTATQTVEYEARVLARFATHTHQ
jgi:hypothetical protein